jgi:CRISPR-associated protein Csm4
MGVYRILIRPTGPWATPWHADTVWGSLCWAIRDLEGETSLAEFLDAYICGSPPLIVSDAFPGELLPFPYGAPFDFVEGEKVKPRWCEAAAFAEWGEAGLPRIVLARDRQRPYEQYGLLRAQRNRLTDTAEEGKLFEVEQFSFSRTAFPGGGNLTIYFRCGEDFAPRLASCWEVLADRGFGKRASVGLGSFEIAGRVEASGRFEIGDRHNGFVALSHFVPAEADPRDGYWSLHAKNPKFSGSHVGRFLKGTLLMLTPGSRFATGGPPRDFYGRMIPMPRPGFEKALHYGLCFAAPVIWR